MKKRIMLSIGVLAIAALVVFNVNLNTNNNSSISLLTIEALANENSNSENSNSNSTWQIGDKKVTVTSGEWTHEVSAGWWIFKTVTRKTMPATTETVELKCCRAQGHLDSCSFEDC